MSQSPANPKISVITIVRNGAGFIERCLQSAVSQEYDNMEYIVLDGDSTDGTQAIIERYRDRISYTHSRPDNGPYDAQVQGIKLASGDLVGFLMADDWLAPGALHALAGMYRAKPQADIFCFSMQEYHQDEKGTLAKTRLFRDPPGDMFHLEDGLYCHGLNRFFSKRIMKQEPYARVERYPQLADRDFYVRLGRIGLQKAWTGEVLYHVVVHEGSNSTGGGSEKISRFLEETAAIARDHLEDGLMTTADRHRLIDWYCFNKIRSVFFLLKSRKFGKAFKQALRLLAHYPLATLKNLLRWRIPDNYRPAAS